jgi:hypothetical protein
LKNGDTPMAAASATRPNFFVIGAAKSGTSAIWHHLQEHPQIYMSPRKQTRFFAFAGQEPDFRGPVPKNMERPYAIPDLETYHGLFDGVRNETAIGEASWTYLYRSEASRRIREYAPEAKLITILRNPVDRAYSHYRQNVQAGREPLADFPQALAREEVRIRDNWWPEFHYVQMGLYSVQLKRYFDTFDRDQIKIYLYEDLVSDPYGLLRDAFGFLGVDDRFTPEAIIRSNPSGAPKSRSLHTLLQRLETIRPAVERLVPNKKLQTIVRFGRNLNNRNITHLQLSPEKRRRIIDEYFREDILSLQDLIHRDIGAWLGSHQETTAAR